MSEGLPKEKLKTAMKSLPLKNQIFENNGHPGRETTLD
jgi:hypothetical protein